MDYSTYVISDEITHTNTATLNTTRHAVRRQLQENLSIGTFAHPQVGHTDTTSQRVSLTSHRLQEQVHIRADAIASVGQPYLPGRGFSCGLSTSDTNTHTFTSSGIITTHDLPI